MKVGVMLPTYKRPDLLRRAVLQLAVQTRKPDVICIHQNGSDDTYEWAINDLKPLVSIKYIHIPKQLTQNFWYLIPLTYLIQENCDTFVWADHDDIYYTNHIQTIVDNLNNFDITLSNTCAILYVKDKGYHYQPPERFTVNPTGGMASSIGFNLRFAKQLQLDLLKDKQFNVADNVIAKVTMPRNQTNMSSATTAVYVAHPGTVSTPAWPDHFVKD